MKNLNLQMTLFIAGLIAFASVITVVIYNAMTIGINMSF